MKTSARGGGSINDCFSTGSNPEVASNSARGLIISPNSAVQLLDPILEINRDRGKRMASLAKPLFEASAQSHSEGQYTRLQKIAREGTSIAHSAIRPATSSDLDAIVAVHERAFPGFFMTAMGKPFLRQYYRLVINYHKHILLVYEASGEIQGFVTAFFDPAQFYRQMSRSKWRFIVPLAIGAIMAPRRITRIFKNAETVSKQTKADGAAGLSHCELSSIAVDPGNMGAGVGRALALALIAEAQVRGGSCVTLTTDAHGNDRVNRFYQGLGFALTRTFDSAGRPMNEYQIILSVTEKGDATR